MRAEFGEDIYEPYGGDDMPIEDEESFSGHSSASMDDDSNASDGDARDIKLKEWKEESDSEFDYKERVRLHGPTDLLTLLRDIIADSSKEFVTQHLTQVLNIIKTEYSKHMHNRLCFKLFNNLFADNTQLPSLFASLVKKLLKNNESYEQAVADEIADSVIDWIANTNIGTGRHTYAVYYIEHELPSVRSFIYYHCVI